MPKHRINLILFITLSIYPLVGMGIDLIAPSLPAISADLHASKIFSKNLITFYLLGYGLGNFLIGFLSDTIGRRKISILGCLVFTIVSFIPTALPHPFLILWMRFFQGFSIAAFAIAGRGSIADILETSQLVRVATLVPTLWGLGPILGPVIGGYLQFYFNWQACFYFFSAYGFLAMLGFYFFVPETHFNRQPLAFTQIKNNFHSIIKHQGFIGLVMIMGLIYSILIVFNTLGPFLIQTELGYSSVSFGHLAFGLGLAFVIGTFICRRLLLLFSSEKIIFNTTNLFTIIAICGLGISYFYAKNIALISMLNLLIFLGCGIIYPTAMGKATGLFRHLAGSGTAVMNLVNILITTFTAFIMSFIHVESMVPIMWIYLILMVMSMGCYRILLKE